MLRLALVGLLVRVVVGLALACVVAAVLALARDSAFVDGLRISVWLVGGLMVLFAFAGRSPAMRMGTIDPLAASFFPELTRRMGERYESYSGPRVSPAALSVVAALALFALGVLLD